MWLMLRIKPILEISLSIPFQQKGLGIQKNSNNHHKKKRVEI